MQLGLLDDAARLFKESGRFDYLNRLYQSAGIWNKAIKVGVCCVITFHSTMAMKYFSRSSGLEHASVFPLFLS